MEHSAVNIAVGVTWTGKTILYGKLDSNWKDVIVVNVSEEEMKKKT